MKLIGISGKMHSGKSYVSDILTDKYGYRRLSFAGPLKDDLREMGFLDADIDQKPTWMRLLMQAYGQARRAEDPDHWVNRLLDQLQQELIRERAALFPEESRIVIDDLRFENEADALRVWADKVPQVELHLVRLHREGYDRTDIPGARDTSETALDDYDFDIFANVPSGDLSKLETAAHDIARWCGGRATSPGSEGTSQ